MNKNKENKNILKSPLDWLKASSVDINEEDASKIRELAANRQDIKGEMKELLEKRKSLSKQVGIAKKENQDVTHIISEVKEVSSTINLLELQLSPIEDNILALIKDLSVADTSNLENKIPTKKVEDNQDLAKEADECDVIFETDFNSIDSFIINNKNASIYHSSVWLSIIKKSFNHDCFLAVARSKDKNVLGALPLVRLKSVLFGDFMVSLPYFNYGGAVTNNPFIAEKLMQAASNKAAQLGVSHVEFRDTIPRENYPVRADKVNMLLQLPESKDLLWESFSSKLRAQIKRAMREDIVVKKGKIELIDDFYDVFAENMRDLGTPVYGKSFFKNILDSVPNSSDLLILYYKGKPVSAAFLLTHNEKMEIPWASTLRRVNHLSANMLLYWEVLSFALDQKCKTFDFGRSSKDAGTFKFKKQWGAKAQNSLWHYWLKDGGDLPALNPNNPKFKLMIAVWKKLPIFVTKIIGPMIVKNLP